MAVEYLSSHFRESLEAKGVILAGIQDEIDEIDEIARKLVIQGYYEKVCYELHVAPEVRK